VIRPKRIVHDLPSVAAPCPNCGYDLRGHADSTRCPECGTQVEIGEAAFQATRWFDLRLLDLWSIGVLQVTGCATALLGLVAIRQGAAFAVILGLLAFVCFSAGSLWFLAIAPAVAIRLRRPFMRAAAGAQVRTLLRWCITDALLVALGPILFTVLRLM